MKFGYKEMREFAESSDDPRVKSMMNRIEELKSKLARQHNLLQELEQYLADFKKP
jgi:septal ring factor EnvC (AmiA/AmiB activator)